MTDAPPSTPPLTTGTGSSGAARAAGSASSSGAGRSRVRGAIEWIVVVGAAVLLAVVLRTFVVQVFSIPSESMQPTLLEGDRVAVEKITYHRRDPQYRDVIVFDNPELSKSSFPGAKPPPDKLIKRVIAVGGDSVVLRDGHVEVNGKVLDEPYVMPGAQSLVLTSKYTCAPENPCVIPQGSVWVMGDNREHSEDSRAFGPIPVDTIVGRAIAVIWPLNRTSGL